MTRARALVLLSVAAVVVSVARAGHELPIYPSYYPHEIEIATLAPGPAAAMLREGKIQAYVGGLNFAGAPPDEVRAVESLGSFIVVRSNPQSALARDEPSACAAVKAVARELAGQKDFTFHPYPVTPFHGDYLHHADLAEAAKARLADGSPATPVAELKVRAPGRVGRPGWSAPEADWDVEVSEVDAAALMDSAALALNGWIAPPWLRTGWFHADRLLAHAVGDPARTQTVEADRQRLMAGDFAGLVERINLERGLVTALTAGCRKIVAGYAVKRQYVNVEFSAGIENIGYDAIDGLHSPIFIRTVKLKDFPWNGWLMLGIPATPAAAWNPIGGMTDPFARLLWATVGDPALLPSPYEAGWMLNRIADVQSSPGQ
jgi:hypothetical protein